MAAHALVKAIAMKTIAGAEQAFTSGELRARLFRHHADIDGVFWQFNDVWRSKAFCIMELRTEYRATTALQLLVQVQGLDDESGLHAAARRSRAAA